MNGKSKNKEDEAGYGAFVVRGMKFYTICKIGEAIGYLLGLEVAWVNLLMEVMVGSFVKAGRIYDGMVRASGQVEDEVIGPFEGW